MKHTVNGQTFKSQAALKGHVCAIIDRLARSTIFPTHEDFDFLADLIKRHEWYTSIVLNKLTGFKIGDKRSLSVLRVNSDGENTELEISWNRCITQSKASSTAYKTVHMRRSITEHNNNFRRSKRLQNKHCCILCRDGSGLLEVDHVSKFSIMRDVYLAENPNFNPSVVSNLQHWTTYHNKNAVLQLLCKSCHLEKSIDQMTIKLTVLKTD